MQTTQLKIERDYTDPTIIRTFSLEDLEIPPINYEKFLTDAVNIYTDFILKYNHSTTLEEAEQKYKDELKESNKLTDDELLEFRGGNSVNRSNYVW